MLYAITSSAWATQLCVACHIPINSFESIFYVILRAKNVKSILIIMTTGRFSDSANKLVTAGIGLSRWISKRISGPNVEFDAETDFPIRKSKPLRLHVSLESENRPVVMMCTERACFPSILD